MPPKKTVLMLSVAIPMGEGDKPPEEFCVLKKGTTQTVAGIYNFTEASAVKCMESQARYGNDYPIDYGHAAHHSMFSPDPAEAGKAAGWFKQEVRDGDLWATGVRWTPRAAKMLQELEYRYFSPVIDHTVDGEVVALQSVALTNLPATYGMEPLMASQTTTPAADEPPKETPPMKSLLIALGLAENATEAEGLAALHKLQGVGTEMLTQTGQKSVPEALGVLRAWKEQSTQVAALTQENADLKKKAASVEMDALLSEAKKAGKLPPALEPELRKMELSQAKAFIAAMPALGVKPAGEPSNGTTTVQLSQEEQKLASLGLASPEQIAKRKAAASGIVVLETK